MTFYKKKNFEKIFLFFFINVENFYKQHLILSNIIFIIKIILLLKFTSKFLKIKLSRLFFYNYFTKIKDFAIIFFSALKFKKYNN